MSVARKNVVLVLLVLLAGTATAAPHHPLSDIYPMDVALNLGGQSIEDSTGTVSVDDTMNMSGNEIVDYVSDARSNAPTDPAAGQMWFDDGQNLLKYYNGTRWVVTASADTVTSQDLQSVLGAGNSAGSYDIDMNGQELRNAKPRLHVLDSGAGAEPRLSLQNVQEGFFGNVSADNGGLRFEVDNTNTLTLRSTGNVDVPSGDLDLNGNSITNVDQVQADVIQGGYSEDLAMSVPSKDDADPLGNVNDGFMYADEEKGWSFSVSEPADGGSLTNLLRPGGGAQWDVSSTSFPLNITINGVNNEYGWVRSYLVGANSNWFNGLTTYGYDGSSWVELGDGVKTGPHNTWVNIGYSFEQYRYTLTDPTDDVIDINRLAGYKQTGGTYDRGAYLAREGGTMYGNIDMNGNSITNINGHGGMGAPQLSNEDGNGMQVGALDSYNPQIKFYDSDHSSRSGQLLISMGENSGSYIGFGREGGGSDFNEYMRLRDDGDLDMNGNSIRNNGNYFWAVISLDDGDWKSSRGNSGTVSKPSSGNTACDGNACIHNFGSSQWAIEFEGPNLGFDETDVPGSPACWATSMGDNEADEYGFSAGARGIDTDSNGHCYGQEDCVTAFVESDGHSHETYGVMCRTMW